MDFYSPTRYRRKLKVEAGNFLGAGAAVLLSGLPARAAETPRLDFDALLAKAPPGVSDASIELLTKPTSEGNVRLRVRFKEKLKQRSLVIRGGKEKTLLRDDGIGPDERALDGTYSAFVQLNVSSWQAEQKRRAEVARRVGAVPRFVNRQLIGKRQLHIPDLRKLKPGLIIPVFPLAVDPWKVDPARELMITDLGVVEDPTRTYEPCTGAGTPMGAWTFGKLMTEMANEPVTGINPSDFVYNWLQQWSQDLTVNGFTVENRAVGLAQFLSLWPKLPDGRLDLAQAPFRLAAIVNRIDLRESTFYGGGSAGEARLVFAGVNCADTFLLRFNVIFEYGIKRSFCSGVRNWAQQWRALGSMVLGSPAYNAALQAITDQFTLRDADMSKLPNRSTLNQLRTNEFGLAELFPSPADWELREFKICLAGTPGCSAGNLVNVTMAQTPDRFFHNNAAGQLVVRDFINAEEANILAGKHLVPLEYPLASPFRGGAIQPSAGFSWQPPGVVNNDARHLFSLATCSGCHTSDTGTDFEHIKGGSLSGFLTGITVTDPVSGVERAFHDLMDRQLKLDAAANMACFDVFTTPLDDLFPEILPPAFVH